eukprot:scaffold133741_cov20-Tisochrysis_lutea.AAC.1
MGAGGSSTFVRPCNHVHPYHVHPQKHYTPLYACTDSCEHVHEMPVCHMTRKKHAFGIAIELHGRKIDGSAPVHAPKKGTHEMDHTKTKWGRQ